MARTRKMEVHERFYIEQNPENLSVKELAKMFSRAEITIKTIQLAYRKKTGQPVQKYVKAQDKVEETPPVTENSTPVDTGPKMGNLMGKRERNGEFVATVMTEAASELADQARKTNKKSFSKALTNAIHKPRGG